MNEDLNKYIEKAWEAGQKRLSDYIIRARKEGVSDQEIKKKLMEIAWKEEDINNALTSLPRQAGLSWQSKVLNLAEFIVTWKKALVTSGIVILLVSFGFRNFFVYMGALKIRNEAVAQLLQGLPEEQKTCVSEKVDKEFLEKLSMEDPVVIARNKAYAKDFASLGECVLHKAQPL